MNKYLLPLILGGLISIRSFSQDTSATPVADTAISVSNLNLEEGTDRKAYTDQPVYKLNLKVDIPVTAITTGVTLFGFTKIYSKPSLTMEELASLDPAKVNRFDRPATKQYNTTAEAISDNLFYGSMPLPLLFLADKRMRKDFVKLTTLYLEAMGATGIIYVSAVHFGDRYRPYAYNKEAPLDVRLRGGSRNSFFAGHPALVGTSTFFMATAYADYHPESKIKWLFYSLAGVATAGTAVTRYLAGRHFPTDLIIGVTLGPLSGILIPRLHKNKDLSTRKTTVMPYFGQSSGLVLLHKF